MALLTHTAVSSAKPKLKEYTKKDGLGLFLNILPNGSKQWLFRFSWQQKQRRMSLGIWPDVDLKTARIKRDECRQLVANNIDPRLHRRLNQDFDDCVKGITFKEYAPTWEAFKYKKLNAGRKDVATRRQSTQTQIERYMRIDFLPGLGNLPMKLITRQDVLLVLRKIEQRGSLSIAKKCRAWLKELFRYALVEGVVELNPAADMDVVAEAQNPVRNNPHLKMVELPEFLVKLRNYRGEYQTQLALRLLLLTGVRTGELRFSTLSYFDLKKELWIVPALDVKQLKKKAANTDETIPAYIVPLSKQAVAVVKELERFRHIGQRYLCSHRTIPDLPISENTLNQAIKRMGFNGRLTGHGIRGTISTALNEMDYKKEWIEAQLSHSDKDQIRATYNHAEYIEQRRKMMQDWANILDDFEQQVSLKLLVA